MGRRTAYTLITVAAVLGWEAPLRSTTRAEVPFRLYQRHLVVAKGSVGPLNDLNLLIDTGTIPSMVDVRIARKLRLQGAPSTLVAFGQPVRIDGAVLDGFRLGSLSSGAVRVGIGNLSYIRDIRIDAILGLDVLVRTSFAIDYSARVLDLAPLATARWTAPLEVMRPFVSVRMMVGGSPLRLLVDTGSPDLVLFSTRTAAVLRKAPWKGEKTVQYASGPARLRRIDLGHIQLGSETWPSLAAWALDRTPDGYPPGLDGVLGVTALGCQRVQFDFARRELGCTR